MTTCLSCGHGLGEIRAQTDSIGRIQYKQQCTTCGYAMTGAIAKTKVNLPVPEWDEGLRKRWASIKYADHALRVKDRQAKEYAEFDAERRAHMQSPYWFKIRQKVLQRDGYRCQGCLEKEASVVHHKTYDRLGNELLIDLVSLCDPCHAAVHRRQASHDA